jgi:predicted nucleic acid-binding protein
MRLYDTRFFFEHYYSPDEVVLQKTRSEIRLTKQKFISAITVHEVYVLTMEKEGRETAEVRANLLEKDFKVVEVNSRIARISAGLRHKYRIPMADSIIAATAQHVNATCVTDDPHITQIKEIQTSWPL